MKIQYELAPVEAAKRKRKPKKRCRGYEILVKGTGGLYFFLLIRFALSVSQICFEKFARNWEAEL